MNIRILDNQTDRKAYDAVAPHPVQSYAWGEVRREMGVQIVRIGVFEGQILEKVFLMTLHPIAKTGKCVGYIPRSEMPTKELLNFLKEYGKKEGIVYVRFEPYVKKEDCPDEYLQQHPSLRVTHQSLFSPWQFLVDLTQDEETLLKKMKAKTRYNIRLAQKKEVVVEERSNDEGLEAFIALYRETWKRQQYHGRSEAHMRAVWKHVSSGMGKILIASYNGEPLAAYMLFLFHDELYYPYGGSSTKERKRMPANALMWETIKLGKKHGARTFNMWGALGPDHDKTDPWAGFSRFKAGFGGDHIQYVGTLDLVISPFWYKLVTFAYDLRKKIWAWRSR